MFKGAKPAGQPRTLRTIAESKNNAAGFVTDDKFHTEFDDSNDKHADDAVAALPSVADARRKLSPADKQPFASVRKV